MTHQRRPGIKKMKCLAQKLTKWRRIEKLWQKRQIESLLKIGKFALCKSCYRPSTKWLSFRPGWSDFAETGLYGFVITKGKKSRSANGPYSAKFEESQNFRAMGRFCPPPPVANRVKIVKVYHALNWKPEIWPERKFFLVTRKQFFLGCDAVTAL